jgi:hypothetical protein
MRATSVLVVALLAVSAALPATAAPNDLHLLGLTTVDDQGVLRVQNDQFVSLVQEMAVVMTPAPVQPAETTGQSGFDFGIDYTIHQISAGESYWTAARVGNVQGRNLVPIMQTIGVRGRKGFVLPLPLTSEIELGGTWITDSGMLNLGGRTRLALNEGFRWIPDIAVEMGINRLIGTEDLDMFTVTAGGQISKGFGISGTFTLAPFVGYQTIFYQASSGIIDPSPGFVDDVGSNIVFNEVQMSEQMANPDLLLHRIEGGLRLQVAIVQLSTGFNFNLLPTATGDRKLVMQYAIRAGMYF